LDKQLHVLSRNPLHILDERLHADPTRVVLRPFHLGWQGAGAPEGRALRLVRDVVSLDEAQVEREYALVLHDFLDRHWQTEHMFEARFEEVANALELGRRDVGVADFSPTRRKLIGAYFCHEYTYAAAALMNPPSSLTRTRAG
jgi:hypothetical protein